MRSLILAMVTAVALAVAGASNSASVATKGVSIKSTGFLPANVTIATTDTVKWTNRDTKNHQVVANNGAFASAIIAPGKSYSHTFNTAGTFRYHDALHPALTGKIIVKGPPPAVTIGAWVPIITYGQSTHISGILTNKQSGQTVSIYEQQVGQASPMLLATLLTGTNGAWDLVIKPTILTTYQARWKTTSSLSVSVNVRPFVHFAASHRYGFVKVRTASSLKGKSVFIQRFTRFHQWVTMRRVILGNNSSKLFHIKLKRGRYLLRAFFPAKQAGPGYLDALSPIVKYRRK
jgi:plastocyanin